MKRVIKQNNITDKLRRHMRACWLYFVACMPLSAMADTNSNMILTGLTGLTDFITGPVGDTICGLAIAAVGFLWLKEGRIDKSQALTNVIGIGVIYSASYFVSYVLHVQA